MPVRLTFVGLVLALLAGCAPATVSPYRIALLAPFEGRYRTIGYDALYAARLALAESNNPDIALLPLDDGGSTASAVDRALALETDPQTIGVIAVGYAAAAAETLAAFEQLPVVIVGSWGTMPTRANHFLLAADPLRWPDDSIFYPAVRVIMAELPATFQASAAPPDADFVTRYQGNDPFAPAPTPLATLTYDALRLMLQAFNMTENAVSVSENISSIRYQGLNGTISWQEQRWENPPIYSFKTADLQP